MGLGPARLDSSGGARRPSRCRVSACGSTCAARVALDDRQPQTQGLPGKDRIGQVRLDLAQPAALGRAAARPAGAAATARSRRRRHGPAGRHCVDGGRGATPSCRSRAARRPIAGRVVRRHRPGPGAIESNSAAATAATRSACATSTWKRCCISATDASRMSWLGAPPRAAPAAASSRSVRSKITPWRSAPRAGCSASMPKWVASVYRIDRPPAMTARRSSFRPGQRRACRSGRRARTDRSASAGRRA